MDRMQRIEFTVERERRERERERERDCDKVKKMMGFKIVGICIFGPMTLREFTFSPACLV